MVTAKLEDLNRAEKQMHVSGIALFVAMYMYENTGDTVVDGKRVYWGSTKLALLGLFPTRDLAKAEEVANRVKPYLRANGFASVPNPNGKGGGWAVPANAPDNSNWKDPGDAPSQHSARVNREAAEAEAMASVLASDVRHKWQCRFAGCGQRFQNQRARGIHESAREHQQVVRGKVITGGQYVLLQAVLERPWEHPRWYAEKLRVSASTVSCAATDLANAGLITKVGKRVSVRYGPPDDTEATERQAAFHRHPSAGGIKHKADAKVVPAPPNEVGLTVDSLVKATTTKPLPREGDWRNLDLYVSVPGAKALLEQLDLRVEELERMLAEAEVLTTEVNGIKVALKALRKPESA
jgi:hypothetical protein